MSNPVPTKEELFAAVLEEWAKNIRNAPKEGRTTQIIKKSPPKERYRVKRYGGTVTVCELSRRKSAGREFVDFEVEKTNSVNYEVGDVIALSVDELKYHIKLRNKDEY